MNTVWIRSVGERLGVSIVSAAKWVSGTSRCRRIMEYGIGVVLYLARIRRLITIFTVCLVCSESNYS